jgi:ferrochelatase
LLVNLGTPDAPTPQAVRAYLKQFLSDPRVVDLPRALWLPILYLFVLRKRPAASAARYERIWTRDGSPLRIYTEHQASLLRGYLGERKRGGVVIDHAMRYGNPSIGSKLATLRERGCERILFVPLYPQYSGSATATAFDAASRALARMDEAPEVRTIASFHDDAGYIRALAHGVRDHWMKRGRPDVLLMSFHGIPRRAVDRGDPYHRQCHETARLLAEELGLPAERWRVAFQSRFGRAEWLKPYTADVLTALGRERLDTLDVICPGFVSDCLETLEEIAIEGKALFLGAGGGEFRYIPCLNDRHEWINALSDMVERNLDTWSSGGPPELEESRRAFLGGDAHA